MAKTTNEKQIQPVAKHMNMAELCLDLNSPMINNRHMPIAGGSANWSRRTNLYNGSECNKPKRTAYLMISAPKIAIIIYRTATIPTSTMSGTFDPFKPKSINGDHYFHVSNNSTSELEGAWQHSKWLSIPSRRFAPKIEVTVGMADSLQTWKEYQGNLLDSW